MERNLFKSFANKEINGLMKEFNCDTNWDNINLEIE